MEFLLLFTVLFLSDYHKIKKAKAMQGTFAFFVSGIH